VSLEPQAADEPGRGDLSAARLWLDQAAAGLPPEVFDHSNIEHLKIAAMLGDGYANIAHFERLTQWRRADLERIAKDRADDLERLARQRDEDIEIRKAEAEHAREREAQAIKSIREAIAGMRRLPCDWKAVHILPGTPYPDEPSEMQPPGWYVFGGFSDDPEEGAAFAIEITEALDRDGTGMSLEQLAHTVAARLNGVQP
jgi:hypothetical protein